jgi:hypothetical protein
MTGSFQLSKTKLYFGMSLYVSLLVGSVQLSWSRVGHVRWFEPRRQLLQVLIVR